MDRCHNVQHAGDQNGTDDDSAWRCAPHEYHLLGCSRVSGASHIPQMLRISKNPEATRRGEADSARIDPGVQRQGIRACKSQQIRRLSYFRRLVAPWRLCSYETDSLELYL